MPKALDFTVIQAQEYADHILALVLTAKKRIVLATMVIEAGEKTGHILRACADAARRGVSVYIVADVFSQHIANKPGNVSYRAFLQQCAYTRELLNDIHALCGTVDWVGRIGINPYAGRYHCKATIIDDNIFSFGGVNFCDNAFSNIDYMLHLKDAQVAMRLAHVLTSLPADDTAIALDAHSDVLYDSGTKGESLIYKRACELVAQSKKVVLVSQMCPTGRLADALKNTASICYFNQPTKTGFKPSTLAQFWDNWRTKVPNDYEGAAYIHAKCMLFELKDGTKALISGSHNFSWRGVAFGTKEIALQSTDAALWRKLHDVVYKVATDGVTR